MIKKITAIGLTAALLMGLSTAAMAEDKALEEKAQTVTAKAVEIKMELQKINGTLEDLRESDLIVKDANGETYRVPILLVKESEDFKSLDLSKGDSITLEGHESMIIEKWEKPENFTLSLEAVNPSTFEKNEFVHGIEKEDIKVYNTEDMKFEVTNLTKDEFLDEKLFNKNNAIFYEGKVFDQNTINSSSIKYFEIGEVAQPNTVALSLKGIELSDTDEMRSFFPKVITANGKTINVHEVIQKHFKDMKEATIQF